MGAGRLDGGCAGVAAVPRERVASCAVRAVSERVAVAATACRSDQLAGIVTSSGVFFKKCNMIEYMKLYKLVHELRKALI